MQGETAAGAPAQRLKILVLTDRFLPEIAAASFRVMDHAREWIEMGHEVTVVTCAPNFPHGRVFEGYRNRAYQEEELEGVRVVRVGSYMAPNTGVVKRTLDNLSYSFAVAAFARRLPECDVILATSPPLFVALAGSWLAKLRRRPWVFEVRDLWPASIRAVGAVSRGLGPLERLEMSLYGSADRIVTVTHAIRDDLVRRGIAPEKVDVATNGVDTRRFDRSQTGGDARSALGVAPGTFLAGYIGTVGMAHGLDTVLDAAERLRGHDHIRLLIMGEGAERARLEAEAAERGLANLLFRDFVPQDEVPAHLAALDLGIVHLRPDPVFLTVIPSKIFEFMAMEVPLVHAVEGESAAIVGEAGAGVCIPSGDAAKLSEAILAASRDPAGWAEMGARGAALVRRDYSRRAKAALVADSLARAVRDHARRR